MNLFSNLADCLKSWDNLSVNWTKFDSIASSNAPAEVRKKSSLFYFFFNLFFHFFFFFLLFVSLPKKNQNNK